MINNHNDYDLLMYQLLTLAAMPPEEVDAPEFDIEYDGGLSGSVSIGGLAAKAAKLIGELTDERDALASWERAARRELTALQQATYGLAHNGDMTPAYACDAKAVLDSKPEACLKRRDQDTAARATRHAADMVRRSTNQTLAEVAICLDEVADMQEANDHGDAE